MPKTRSDRRKTKELKVLELHEQGYSSRKIVSLVQLSLRDLTKYIHRISNKTKSPSTVSIMDEVVLGYRVTGLEHELRDLEIKRENLKDEVNNLRAKIPGTNFLFRKLNVFIMLIIFCLFTY